MAEYESFSGVITRIDDFWVGNGRQAGCYKLMSVENSSGNRVDFVVAPATYFVDHTMVSVGDTVTGFYDTSMAAPAIYPPQFRAVVMARDVPGQSVKVDYFNDQLLSGDGTLKLNLAPSTRVLIQNGQAFTGTPANRDLIVVYGPTTRSIPAQTTPSQIIVICER